MSGAASLLYSSHLSDSLLQARGARDHQSRGEIDDLQDRHEVKMGFWPWMPRPPGRLPPPEAGAVIVWGVILWGDALVRPLTPPPGSWWAASGRRVVRVTPRRDALESRGSRVHVMALTNGPARI